MQADRTRAGTQGNGKGSVLDRNGKGSATAAKAAGAQGKGSALAAKAAGAQGKGSVLAAKAVGAQGKGSVLPVTSSSRAATYDQSGSVMSTCRTREKIGPVLSVCLPTVISVVGL